MTSTHSNDSAEEVEWTFRGDSTISQPSLRGDNPRRCGPATVAQVEVGRSLLSCRLRKR